MTIDCDMSHSHPPYAQATRKEMLHHIAKMNVLKIKRNSQSDKQFSVIFDAKRLHVRYSSGALITLLGKMIHAPRGLFENTLQPFLGEHCAQYFLQCDHENVNHERLYYQTNGCR